MYGLIGKMRAKPGEREALIGHILESSGDMPGCLSYVVAHDSEDADALWITEVWTSEEAHRGSLALPAVKEAIAAGRPLIAGMSNFTTTRPVGGHGLAQAAATAS